MSEITVAGHGKATGRPDTMSMTVGVSVQRPTVGEAVTASADAAERLLAALAATGVAEADIATSGYTVSPEHDPDEHRRVIGYRVDHTMTVTVRDLGRAGVILDSATGASGDDVLVGGVSFRVADDERMLAGARESAWRDAKTKAEQLASLAGVELGPPERIAESVLVSPRPTPYRAAEMAMAAATPIPTGEQTVAVDLSVTFTIGG